MRKKIHLVISVTLCFLFLAGFLIYPVAATTKVEAYETQSSGSDKYISRIDMQGDAVYEDAGGYTEFAIWLNGKNYVNGPFFFSTRVLIEIYYTAYYKYEHVLPSVYTSYNWEVPPEDLIDWTGDWEHNHDYDDVWSWEVDSNDRYTNGENWDGTSGGDSYYSTNSIDGTYRYLGYALSSRSGSNHQFDALLKLHIDNEEAEDWDNGVLGGNPPHTFYTKYLLQIRVKLVFKFQYEWYGWNTVSTHEHILGDGSPAGDLSSIPLEVGEVFGLQ